MTRQHLRTTFAGVVAALAFASVALGQTTTDAPAIRPDAIVNLASSDGIALVRGQ
jgi:hypothetical protein